MVIFTSFLGTPRWELSTANGRERLVRTVPSFSIFGVRVCGFVYNLIRLFCLSGNWDRVQRQL